MGKRILILMAFLCVTLLANGSLALAKAEGHSGTPPGFAKGDKKGWHGESTPPGWTKGKKKGWKDAGMPPGLKRAQQ